MLLFLVPGFTLNVFFEHYTDSLKVRENFLFRYLDRKVDGLYRKIYLNFCELESGTVTLRELKILLCNPINSVQIFTSRDTNLNKSSVIVDCRGTTNIISHLLLQP